MELLINRINVVMAIVDEMLSKVTGQDDKKCGYIHLYGVSQLCGLIAKKRGLDTELAQIIGLLHDYYTYKTGDSTDHAQKGADMIIPILAKTELFSVCEIGNISKAIQCHSEKDIISDEPYVELLKDADVLQHVLFNTSTETESQCRKQRFEKLRAEFGLRF